MLASDKTSRDAKAGPVTEPYVDGYDTARVYPLRGRDDAVRGILAKAAVMRLRYPREAP